MPSAVRRLDRARLGPLSLWLLGGSALLQALSLAQQLSYLFAPRPGELGAVIAGIVAATLLGVAAVVAGCVALASRRGRRTGAFGAALALASLVLFGAASSFGWGFLAALSATV